jgi:hypothetical protein
VTEIEFVPDVSHHQSNPTTGAHISITRIRDEGAAAVLARVGQGAGLRRNGVDSYGTTRDRMWQTFLAEAKRIGFPILPYWYIGNRLSAADNAAIAADWVGDQGLKWMLDHEDASGDIAFYNAVLAAFEKRGLDVVLGYVPRWYWANYGGTIAGPALVNSRYINSRTGTASQIYGDGSAYVSSWASYGGNKVGMVQFTNQAVMAGWKIDCSAFSGTRQQLFNLIGGTDMPITRDDFPLIREAVWGISGGDIYDGLMTVFEDAANQNPAGGKADRLRTALRTILNGLPVSLSEAALEEAATKLAPLLNQQGAGGLTVDQVKTALRDAMGRLSGTVNFTFPPAE